MGDPCGEQSLYALYALYASVKAGHWETEKAAYKVSNISLKGTSQKTCFDVQLKLCGFGV